MYLSVLITYLFLSFSIPAPQVETWYVWIDTYVTSNGHQTRMVSEKPFAVTCCLKSGKYNRLNKAAEKWIRKNYDPEYKDTALKNIQDESLALIVTEKAILESKENHSIIIVDYTRVCN